MSHLFLPHVYNPKTFTRTSDEADGHLLLQAVLSPTGSWVTVKASDNTLLERNGMYFYWQSRDEVCLEICFTNKLAHKLSIYCFEIFFHV